MKTFAIFAAVLLIGSESAFADRKVVVVSGGYGRGYASPGYSRSYRGTYVRNSRWFAPYPRYYSSPRYYYGSRFYAAVPAVQFSYSSGPRYYSNASVARDTYSLEVNVQQELRRRGYYRGALDGDIGPASRSAIRAYQADHGLYSSGRIDSALLRSLGI